MSKRRKMIRIVVVGDSFVGKTRLIRMFVDGGARDDYESTIGIDYMDKRLDVKGHPVYLQLWDTAGQERFRALTSNFYNRAHACVLVFDLTNEESFENVRSWVREVHSNAPQSIPLLLCGNKADKEGRRVLAENARLLAQEYNALYFETSARNGTNIEEMFTTLAEQVYERIYSAIQPDEPTTVEGVALGASKGNGVNSEARRACCS